jgi:hypothetical protein
LPASASSRISYGRLAAVHHEALDGLALDERLAVGKQRDQFLQSLGAAELAQQERGRAAHFPVGGVHQLLHRLAPLGAEPEQDVAQPLAGAASCSAASTSASGTMIGVPMAWHSA